MAKKRSKNQGQEIPKIAAKLDNAVNLSAFHLFRNPTFRRFIEYHNQSQIDRDRIFNEVVVSFLLLMVFAIEEIMKTASAQEQQNLDLVKNILPSTHVSYLAKLGVEKEYLTQWHTLIDMRLEECLHDKERIRSEAVAFHSKEKELAVDDHVRIQSTLPIHTVAINLHHHILKGKIDQPNSDVLYQFLFKKIADSYIDDRILIRYGKVSMWQKLWRKAWVKWKVLMGEK